MDYRARFTIIPFSKEYKPITIVVKIPEELALMMMATPVGQVSIGVERSGAGGILLDKTPLLDFK